MYNINEGLRVLKFNFFQRVRHIFGVEDRAEEDEHITEEGMQPMPLCTFDFVVILVACNFMLQRLRLISLLKL